jgi:hypothetical protein
MNHDAIYKLNPTVAVIRGDIAYDINGNEVAYDKSAVEDHMASKAYIAKRVAEYPSIGDQLDAIWKGGDAAAAMLAQVQAVKDKFPK